MSSSSVGQWKEALFQRKPSYPQVPSWPHSPTEEVEWSLPFHHVPGGLAWEELNMSPIPNIDSFLFLLRFSLFVGLFFLCLQSYQLVCLCLACKGC